MYNFKTFHNLSLFENKIPAKNKNGKCFEVALEYMYKNPTATLVHGLVTGQGPIEGILYNHAWVEKGNTVIDETVSLEIPKKLYYMIGQIKESNVYRYSIDEMNKKLLEYKTYGPWEKKLLKNKY